MWNTDRARLSRQPGTPGRKRQPGTPCRNRQPGTPCRNRGRLAAEDAISEQIANLAAEDAVVERAADLATEVSEADKAADRRRLTASLAAAAHSGARATGRGVRAARRGMGSARRGMGSARRGMGSGGGRLAAQVVAMAQRLRIRDQAALRAQFPGKSSEEIADALIEGAARASAAVGGAVGAWAALPVLPAYPVEIATETLALIGIEIKLVAELHEAYGTPAAGTGRADDRLRRGVGAPPWCLHGPDRTGPGRRIPAGAAAALAARHPHEPERVLAGPAAHRRFRGCHAQPPGDPPLGHSVRADLRRQVQQGAAPDERAGPGDSGSTAERE